MLDDGSASFTVTAPQLHSTVRLPLQAGPLVSLEVCSSFGRPSHHHLLLHDHHLHTAPFCALNSWHPAHEHALRILLTNTQHGPAHAPVGGLRMWQLLAVLELHHACSNWAAGRAFPGAAPVGLDRSDTRAFATGTLPSLRALEKKAAQLAAKAMSSAAAELHAR